MSGAGEKVTAVEPIWAPSRKSSLGDVWHHVRYGSSAHCDHRVRLIMSDATKSPDGYRCRRCISILAALAKGTKP